MISRQCVYQSVSTEWVTREQGLPSHQLHNLIINEGKLWLATPNGLAIFDGEQVTVLDQKQSLLTHGIRSLVDDDGHILVCSDSGIDRINSSNLILNASISTVELGLGCCQSAIKVSKNNYLIACANGLRLWNSETAEVRKLDSPLDNEYIVKIIGFGRGSILIQGVQSGLWLFSEDALNPFTSQAILGIGEIRSISQQANCAWLMTDSHALQLDADFHILECIKLPDGLGNLRAIFQVSEDKILVADMRQLLFIEKHQQHWKIGQPVQQNILVNAISQDNYGNLWVATDYNGLLKISALNQFIKSYRSENSNAILSLQHALPIKLSADKIDDSPYILIGGTTHSVYLPTQNPQAAQELVALRNIACWDLKQIEGLGFWAATDKGLVHLEQFSQQQATYHTDERVAAGRCICSDKENLIYGCLSGLFKFNTQSQKFEALLDKKQNSIGYIYSLKRQSADSLIVATLGNGLWLYDCHSEKLERIYESLDATNVYAVDIDRIGRLLIAADNKIWVVDGDTQELVSESDDSIAAWCCSWLSHNRILLGTSKGLKVFDLESEEFSFIIDNFPRRKFWEFTTARSLLAESDDIYWCGLNEGLEQVQLRQLEEIVPAPVPTIKQIKSNFKFDRKHGKLSIKEGNWSIRIQVGSAWLWQEYSLKYQYRLLGLLPNWRNIDGTTIEFTTLPVGEYLLEVSTTNILTQSAKHYQLLIISVEKKGWFAHQGLVISNNLKWLFSKIRKLKQLLYTQQRYNEMELLVQNRTQELSEANQELTHLNKSLENLSHKDQLTSLYNRRYFFEQLASEVKRAMRDKLPLSVMMIDIDYFKNFNDNYGHLAGDACLRRIAEQLQQKFYRSGEVIARFGGEEFVALMHNTTAEGAINLARQCIEAIESIAVPHEHSECASHVTISIGIASGTPVFQPGKDSWVNYRQLIMQHADEALYQAKEQGRNRVCAFSETPE